MTNEEQKLQEIVERWMGKKHPITMRSYVSDLTALIEEHYYPKRFLLWTHLQNYWLFNPTTCKWTSDEPTAFQEEETTDELYQYWKENER